MRFKWRKLLFRLIGFELLSQEAIKLIYKSMHNVREEGNKKLMKLMLQGMLLIGMLLLFNLALGFSLFALALYLNEVFYSTYKGLLLVAGICIVLLLMLLVVLKMHSNKKKT